jgi:hypothetical protein
MDAMMKAVRSLHDWYFRLSPNARWLWGFGGILLLLLVLEGLGSGSSGDPGAYVTSNAYPYNAPLIDSNGGHVPAGDAGRAPYTRRTAGGLIGSDGRTSYYNDPQSGVSVIPGEGVVY